MPSNLIKFGDWIYVMPLAVIGLGLGLIGYMTCLDCTATGVGAAAAPAGFGTALIHTLALIKASGGFPLDARRGHAALFFAQIIMPCLAFFSVFKLVLQGVRRDTRVLLAQRLKGHTIVCGLGDTGRQVVHSFRDAHKQVVAIALAADTPFAAACERRHVAVLEGDAAQKGLLKIAGLRRADCLIIACGSDGANLEIAMRARDMLAGAGRSVKILPEVRSEWLFDLVRTRSAGPLSTAEAEFQLFNLAANAARQLLRTPFFLRAAPAAPHLLFAGLGRVSTEILLRAARCNFALPGCKLSATILDERGPASIAAAEESSAGIRNIADIAFQPCEFTAEESTWQDMVGAEIQARPPLAVIVAVKQDDVALSTAMRFRKILDAQGLFATPIFVRIREQRQLAAFLSGLETQSVFRDRLTAFGDLSFLAGPAVLLDQSLDILARASHEVWLAGNPGSGSSAMAPWNKLSEFYKQANRALADYIPVRLRSCGFRLADGRGPLITLDEASVEKLAALEHWRWSVEFTSLGWRPGAKRDDFLKLHEGLVAWDSLPESAREFNRAMARQLPQIADAAGMHILRDRLVFVDGGLVEALAHPQEATQLVVAADPADAQGWMKARAAQAGGGAKLWALLRHGTSPQLFKTLENETGEIEMLLNEDEWAALRPSGAA